MTVPLRVQFRLVAHRDAGLKAAPRILSKELRGGLDVVSNQLIKSSRARMRRDSGETQKSVRGLITGEGMNLSLDVSSALIQAFVDAYGMHRGIFPPFKPGTRIYSWAGRRVRGLEVRGTTGKTPHGPAKPKHRNVKLFRTVAKIRTVRNAQGLLSVSRPVGVVAKSRTEAAKIRQLAFLIARAIFRRGLKGSEWNIKALQANQKFIVNQLQNSLYRAANNINRA
jgi:hypothetical protein